MTSHEPPVCDCPEPCACYAEGYAAGKDKAYFEVQMALQDDTHADSCGCQPCQVKRACIQKAMSILARSSQVLFELPEDRASEDNGNQN